MANIGEGTTSTNDKGKIEWVRKNIKTVSRATIYAKIRKWQEENPNSYITGVKDHDGKVLTGASGKGLTAEEFIQHVESENAHGHMVISPRAGTYGGVYRFMPGGQIETIVKVPTTPEEEQQAIAKLNNDEQQKKGGIWEWIKKWGGWLAAGLIALGVAAYFIFRKKPQSKTVYVKDPNDTPVMPTPDNPGNDNPGNDKPGNDNPGNGGNDNPGGNDWDFGPGGGSFADSGIGGDTGKDSFEPGHNNTLASGSGLGSTTTGTLYDNSSSGAVNDPTTSSRGKVTARV